MIDRNEDPEKECLVSQRSSFRKLFVEFRVSHRNLGRDILVQYQGEDRQHSVDSCIANHQEALIEGDGRKVKNGREDSLHRRDDESSVNDKLGQGCRTLVRSSTVNQEQADNVAELRNRKVRSK